MKVLVVGAGGREHALCWAIARSPRVDTFCVRPGAPESRATRACCRSIWPTTARSRSGRARGHGPGGVGPEDPLVRGVADAWARRASRCSGRVRRPRASRAARRSPRRSAAPRHPDARAARCSRMPRLPSAGCARIGPDRGQGGRMAAGKGVAVCDGPDEALARDSELMRERRSATPARACCSRSGCWARRSRTTRSATASAAALGAAQDHKRALEGDSGENTGGMGAYSPPRLRRRAARARRSWRRWCARWSRAWRARACPIAACCTPA